eukprot:TRINITY_DN495_c0_g1_i1.p1 TRINITY_DN495_c0_g1~~TRINITY_DN495_c0_g1_i1.p1  ORF type:complete len:720 (+),score=297.45 TRINITY_DN495_c0_g1_i1:78-2237(+)
MEEGDGTPRAPSFHADPTAAPEAAPPGGPEGYGLKMLVVSSPRSKNKSLRVLEDALSVSGRALRRSASASEHVFTVEAADEATQLTTSCVDVAVRDAKDADTPLNLVLPGDLHAQVQQDAGIKSVERPSGHGLKMLVVSSPRSKNKSLRVLEETLGATGRALQRSIVSVAETESAPRGGSEAPTASFSSPGGALARVEDIVDDLLERRGRGCSVPYDKDAPQEAVPVPSFPTPPAAPAPVPAPSEAVSEAKGGDDFMKRWRAVKKHIFIYSSASRPIYTRFGDETDFVEFFSLLGLMADLTKNTMLSTMKRDLKAAAPSGGLREPTETNFVRTGGRVYVFTRFHDIHFCAAAVTNESVKQIEAQLRFLNSMLLSMLTSVMYGIFQKRHNYDLRGLMGNSASAMLTAATRYMHNNPAFALGTVPVLPVRRQTRDAINKAFKAAVRQNVDDGRLVYGFLLFHTQNDAPYGGVAGSNALLVVSQLAQKHQIHPKDFGVLSTFVLASLPPSSKYQAIFSPCCLPEHDPDTFLYMYCTFLSPGVCLVLASFSTECFPQFAAVKDTLSASFQINTAESKSGVPNDPTSGPLAQLARAALYGVGDMDTPERGVPTDVMHFLYKDSSLLQHTATKYAEPFIGRKVQKQLLRQYLKAREGAQAGGGGKKWMVHEFEHYTVLVRLGKYYECFICFQPGTSVAAYAEWPTVLKKWVRQRSDDVFCPVITL